MVGYTALSCQIQQIKYECDVVLVGDFNVKLKISKETCEQAKSRNGKFLQEMITENNLTPATINAAIPSSDETGRYAWISRSAGFCRTGSGWPAGPTLQWARPQPTEPHVVRHTYNLRRHETVDPILNSYSGHTRLMITLPTELWSNNWENKVGYNRASCIIS